MGTCKPMIALAVLALVSGCGRSSPEPRVYHEIVFSEPGPSDPHAGHDHAHEGHDHGDHPHAAAGLPPPSGTPAPASAPAEAVAASARPGAPLVWTTPEGWTELPPSGMRTATFNLPDPDFSEGGVAECTIIVLGGMAGSRYDNIVRWLGQLDRPADPDRLRAFLGAMPEMASSLGTAHFADLSLLMGDAGPSALSTLAAFIDRGSHTIFVKLTGSMALIERERARFIALSESIAAADDAPSADDTPSAETTPPRY